jgi:hypothetical protein
MYTRIPRAFADHTSQGFADVTFTKNIFITMHDMSLATPDRKIGFFLQPF